MFNPQQRWQRAYLENCDQLIVPVGTGNIATATMVDFLSQLEMYGYTLNEPLFHAFQSLSTEDFARESKALLLMLRAVRGEVDAEPMYPNFPEQVRQMSEEALRQHAFVHYLGHCVGLRIVPVSEKVQRPELEEIPELTVLRLSNEDEHKARMVSFLERQSALSYSEREEFLAWFEDYPERAFGLFPDTIPNRETKALLLGKALWKVSEQALFHWAKRWGYTATDVLRLVVARLDGDISLAVPCRFYLKRAERRVIVQLLAEIAHLPSTLEDMFRHRERWKRLAERLHPHEQKRFVAVSALFEGLRGKAESFNARWLNLLEKGETLAAVDVLSERAGVFARHLDVVLRRAARDKSLLERWFGDNNEEVLRLVAKRFEAVAHDVPTPLLLKLYEHFQYRNDENKTRVFFPKGQVAKAWIREEYRAPLPKALCEDWVARIKDLLIQRFSEKPPLGKVYLDVALKNYPVPFQQRSASKALCTLPRGSQMALDFAHTLRFFVYWQQAQTRVDVDLSAVFFGENFNYLQDVSYMNLKCDFALHSGDLTSAPEGATEFLDVDWQSALAAGVRYVVVSVNSFSGQAYKDLPACFAGVMQREQPQSGEIFEPKTVKLRWDLSSDAQINLPLVVDLKEKRLVWLDLALTQQLAVANNVREHLSSMALVVQNMMKQSALNLYDLFMLHAQARGELVDTIAQADWVFSVQVVEGKNNIVPSDGARIISAFVSPERSH